MSYRYPTKHPCEASMQHYCNYLGADPDATGRMSCPLCGKVVLLRPKNGVIGTRSIIPSHLPAIAKATGSAA